MTDANAYEVTMNHTKNKATRVRSGGWVEPSSPENLLNFSVKMVSCHAFWVAISYRLAACFTRIGSACGNEFCDVYSEQLHLFPDVLYSSHTE